jgi:hypothetical protein
MAPIPDEVARRSGARPGSLIEWQPGADACEFVVRVLPDRAALGRRLRGSLRSHARGRDPIAELMAEREGDA